MLVWMVSKSAQNSGHSTTVPENMGSCSGGNFTGEYIIVLLTGLWLILSLLAIIAALAAAVAAVCTALSKCLLTSI